MKHAENCKNQYVFSHSERKIVFKRYLSVRSVRAQGPRNSEEFMKANSFTAITILATIAAATMSDARAASCDQHQSKFLWRNCMSTEVNKLTSAISQKALDLCNSKSSGVRGPAAVDERLACRVDKLRQTLQGMN